jgi:uroporphyrinogen-III synthase
MIEDGHVICALPVPDRKVLVMARWLARKAVIEGLKARGYKVQYMELATISEATEAYLRKHGADLI